MSRRRVSRTVFTVLILASVTVVSGAARAEFRYCVSTNRKYFTSAFDWATPGAGPGGETAPVALDDSIFTQ
jgi:hypothetical protein